MDPKAEEILEFWLNEVGEQGWYEQSEALDTTIRQRFMALWELGRRGELDMWTCAPESVLALLILLDQFPRNMFRGDARAFASDGKALAVAKQAIRRGFDLRIAAPERQFFYLPLMHSETLSDQDKCMRLILLNLGKGSNFEHARAHREVIRRYGRFPFRNAALGRRCTEAEDAFLAAGGYPTLLQRVPEEVDA